MSLNKKHLILLALVTLTTGVSLRMTSILGDGSAFEVAGEGSEIIYTPDYQTINFDFSYLNNSWGASGSAARTASTARSIFRYSDADALAIEDETQFFILSSNISRLNEVDGTLFLLPNFSSGYSWNAFTPTGKSDSRQPGTSRASNFYHLTRFTIELAKRGTLNQNVQIYLDKTVVSQTPSTIVDDISGEETTVTTYNVTSTPISTLLRNTSLSPIGESYLATTNSLTESTLNTNLITLSSTFAYTDAITTYRIRANAATFIKSINLEYTIDYGDC